MTIIVSMPTYCTPPRLVQRAIGAVLGQTYQDLRLVVTIDGPDHETRSWLYEWARSLGDDRLAIWERSANRGRYWSDAVVLRATDSPLFAVHDADDAARPRWLETLATGLSLTPGAAAAFGTQVVHRLNGRTVAEPVKRYDAGRGLQHLTHMAGLYSREWLEGVGGPHPAFRVGFDTLLTALPHLTGHSVAVVDEPLYDRYKRRLSLTTHTDTGMRSRYRAQVAAALATLWQMIVDTGETSVEAAALTLAGYPSPQQYDSLDEQVDLEADRLRAVLGYFAPAAAGSLEAAEVSA